MYYMPFTSNASDLMQRIVIEVDVVDFAKMSGDRVIEKIKSLEVLHFIKQDKEEMIIIASVEFKDPSTKLDEVFNEKDSLLQVLDHSKEGKYLILSKSKPQNDPTGQILASEFWAMGGYMLTPLEIKNGKLKMSFLGSAKQMRIIPSLLKATGISYKVLQLADANSSPDSPLSQLTEKQRKVLTAAYNYGYYDLPRKIDSRQLSEKLKIGSSDFIKHRRKAERRVLSEVLKTA